MWYLIVLGIIVLVVVLLASVFAIWAYIDYKKILHEEELNEQYTKEYNEHKERLILRQYYKDLKLEHDLEQDDYKIIGIREPVGKWTKMITDQQAGSYLAAARMFVSEKLSAVKFGKWQLMVKAQSLMGSQGKNRGRGR